MSITGQHLNEILKYPLQDKQWFSKLCLQGGLLFFLSMFFVGIPFMLGYTIICIRKGINADPTLPGWDQWGEYWTLGWRGLFTGLFYSLPIWIAGLFLMLPAVITFIIAESNSRIEEIAIIGFILAGLFMMIVMVYSLLLYVLQPAYLAAIAAGRTTREAIQFRTRIWPYVKVNFGAIVIGLIIAYVAGLIGSIGIIAFFIGIFLTYPYSMAAMGYTYGIIYRESTVKM